MNKIRTTVLSILTTLLLPMYLSATNPADNKTTDKPYTAEEIEDARILDVPIEEYRSLTSEMKEIIRTSYAMLEFLTVENNQVKVTISKEEAIAKGISAANYDRVLSDLEAANSFAKKAIESGDNSFQFPNIKEAYKCYKQYLAGEITLDEFKNSKIYTN